MSEKPAPKTRRKYAKRHNKAANKAAAEAPKPRQTAEPQGEPKAPRKRARVKARPGMRALNRLTRAQYDAAFRVYNEDRSVSAVAAVTGCSQAAAKLLIEKGLPDLGLPPLGQRVKALAALVEQMDLEESTRRVAIGRGALGALLSRMAREVNLVDLAGMAPDQFVRGLLATITLAENIHEKQKNDSAGMGESEDLAAAFAPLLDELRRRLPSAEKGAIPEAADLRALPGMPTLPEFGGDEDEDEGA